MSLGRVDLIERGIVASSDEKPINREGDLTEILPPDKWVTEISSGNPELTLSTVERLDLMRSHLDNLAGEPKYYSATLPDLQRSIDNLEGTLRRGLLKSTNLIEALATKPNLTEDNLAGQVLRYQAALALRKTMEDNPGLNFQVSAQRASQRLLEHREMIINSRIGGLIAPDVTPMDEAAKSRKEQELLALELAMREVDPKVAALYTTANFTAEFFTNNRSKITNLLQELSLRDRPITNQDMRIRMLLSIGAKYNVFTGRNGSSQADELRVAQAFVSQVNPSLYISGLLDSRGPNVVTAENKPTVAPNVSSEALDLTELEIGVIDKEHIKFYPEVVVFPDTHGLNPEAILDRIKNTYSGRNVEMRGVNIFVDGKKVEMICLGDIFDLEKQLLQPNAFPTEKSYLDALNDPSNTNHKKAKLARDRAELYKTYSDGWKKTRQYNIAEGYQFWKPRIEEGNVIMGNHELMMMGAMYSDTLLFNWLPKANGGGSTFESLTGQSPIEVAKEALISLGIDTSLIALNDNLIDLSTPAFRQYGGIDYSKEIAKALREELHNSELGKDVLKTLRANFKLYNIVNGVLVTHAGVPIDSSGNLTQPDSSVLYNIETGADGTVIKKERRSNEELSNKYPGAPSFLNRIAGKVGIELYDEIENIVKNGSEEEAQFAIVYLAYGNNKTPSPVWMRSPFQETMESNGEGVIRALNSQMVKKGGPQINYILVGHTPNPDGANKGKLLLGDTADGTPIKLRLTKEGAAHNLTISAPHNFAKAGEIGGKVEKAK